MQNRNRSQQRRGDGDHMLDGLMLVFPNHCRCLLDCQLHFGWTDRSKNRGNHQHLEGIWYQSSHWQQYWLWRIESRNWLDLQKTWKWNFTNYSFHPKHIFVRHHKNIKIRKYKNNLNFGPLDDTSHVNARHFNIINCLYLLTMSLLNSSRGRRSNPRYLFYKGTWRGVMIGDYVKDRCWRFLKKWAKFDHFFFTILFLKNQISNSLVIWLTLVQHLIGRIDWRLLHRHMYMMQNFRRQARRKVEFWTLLVLRIDLHLGFDRNSGYRIQRRCQKDLMQYWSNHTRQTMMTRMDLLGSYLGDGGAIGPMSNPGTPMTISEIAF